MLTTDLGACEWFVWDLRRSNLIDRGQLDQVIGEFLTKHPGAEPPALAELLVAQGVLTTFQADRVRLEQVAINLLNNAAKFTDPGGRITVKAFREGAEAVLRVSDTGIGMAPELLPQVFELFTQGQRDLDRSEGGLGIGLTIAKRLVELHGGTVQVQSPGAGGGSEFTVRLPLAAVPVSNRQ